MAQKSFNFEFEDRSPKSPIIYDSEGADRLRTSVEGGVPFVWANKAGMLALAKLLIQIGRGEHKQGFHIHLRSDFSGDASRPDVLTILLDETAGSPQDLGC